MHLTRATVLLLCVISRGPLLGAEGHNPLLPRPQEIHYGGGRLAIAGLEIGFATGPTRQDQFAAEELASGLRSRANVVVPVSSKSAPHRTIVLDRIGSGPDLPQPDEQPGPDSREAYTIKVTSDGAEIRAKSSAGLFYGVQTLLQLVEGSGAEAAIPEVEIHDWPSLAYRGTMVDMSHGPLPTEEEIKRQIDFLSRWKDNQYFLYSETSIEMQGYPLMSPKARFTSEQVRRIIDYARWRHVDVVPCVELYGHLHDLFRIERYADLAVVPHGQDFNALDPRVMSVVSDWVDQLAQLFPSPFMHIGFDEPYDLQKSSELSKVPPEKLYLQQLTRVVKLVQTHGKRVLFWADMENVLQKHPEIIPELPPGLIGIPWHDFLEKDYSPWLAPLAAHHIPEFASTYIHNCLSIFPDFNQTFLIIDGILAPARKYGASGMLINLWTDSNQDLYRMALAGMAYGAAAPWQSGPMAREQFFSEYARIVYPPTLAAEVAPALQEMSDAETLMEKLFGEETMVMMWADPFSPDILEHYRGHHDDLRQVRLLAEQAQERIDHALALKGDPYSLASLHLGAEMLDYAGMRYIDALEMAEAWQHMGARPGRHQLESALHEFCNGCLVHYAAGDLMDAVTELREDYRTAWLAEYSPYRLGASLGKFDREYLYWYGFSRWLRRLETGFHDGDTLPQLESYHAEY
jgi:hexosaminidase